DFFTLPPWANGLKWLLMLVVLGYLLFALPRLGAGLGAGLSAVLLVAFLGVEIVLLGVQGLWLPMTLPAGFLFAGRRTVAAQRSLVAEQGVGGSEQEGPERNRVLGRAFQRQGRLDRAFENRRGVRVGDDVMDLLHPLPMDFERKRQFSRAGS